MSVESYISSKYNDSALTLYDKGYIGGVQLIEKSGFSPFKDKTPLNSTLNQIFENFSKNTGIGVDSDELRGEFLEEYPAIKYGMKTSLYSGLENTFSAPSAGHSPPIVDFLNTKIDEYVADKDEDEDGSVNISESGLEAKTFRSVDTNRDEGITADEMKSNFYRNFRQLNSILNFFTRQPGSIINLTA